MIASCASKTLENYKCPYDASVIEKIKIDFNKNRYLTGKIDIFSKYSNLSGKFKFNDKFAGNINLYNQECHKYKVWN